MGGVLAEAQRQLGAKAWSVDANPGQYHFRGDQVFDAASLEERAIAWARFVLTNAPRFDVFHFYFGYSLLGPGLWDVPWLKRMGKRVVFHFCGCDVRDAKAIIARYPFSACHQCWPFRCSLNRPRATEMARRYCDAVFVSTPDLLEFVPSAELVPQPIDLERFDAMLADRDLSTPPGRPGVDRPVRVAHAPSDRGIKGTDRLEEAIESLRAGGRQVELVLLEKMAHADALARCASCDLAVDQLLVGSYGQYAAEMMALGKPTLCYVRPELMARYPDGCPIINAGPEDIEGVLGEWIDHPEWWPDTGRRGRAYVQAVHGKLAVARQCLAAYRRGR
jgi:hypothetical protein